MSIDGDDLVLWLLFREVDVRLKYLQRRQAAAEVWSPLLFFQNELLLLALSGFRKIVLPKSESGEWCSKFCVQLKIELMTVKEF